MVILAENPQEAFRERPRIFSTAGVGHRLSAAGLFFGKLDVYAEFSKNAQRGESDAR